MWVVAKGQRQLDEEAHKHKREGQSKKHVDLGKIKSSRADRPDMGATLFVSSIPIPGLLKNNWNTNKINISERERDRDRDRERKKAHLPGCCNDFNILICRIFINKTLRINQNKLFNKTEGTDGIEPDSFNKVNCGW